MSIIFVWISKLLGLENMNKVLENIMGYYNIKSTRLDYNNLTRRGDLKTWMKNMESLFQRDQKDNFAPFLPISVIKIVLSLPSATIASASPSLLAPSHVSTPFFLHHHPSSSLSIFIIHGLVYSRRDDNNQWVRGGVGKCTENSQWKF